MVSFNFTSSNENTSLILLCNYCCTLECCSEYLATFKKTVAMHEAFLTRLATHPVFRNDHNFRVFLEYEQDLAVRSKNKIEKFEVTI